jgi:pimeloyl-ACP methyl ester carboxylesterase
VLPALIRATVLLVPLALPAAAGQAPAAEPIDAAPFEIGEARPAGPGAARGALVWLHGAYDPRTEARPDDPDWLAPLHARGYDLWYFNRPYRPDPLAAAETRLIDGLGALRRAGYRRIVVAGFSRGAFIGLAALARPDLADAVIAVSPAAHGPRPERRPEALAAFAELFRAAEAVRIGLVFIRNDRLDPGPEERAATARASAAGRAGMLQLVDRPAGIEDHMGSFGPEFARRFGACLAEFADAAAGADACAGR